MCGLGGCRTMDGTPITKECLDTLLITNEHRGNDASGIALQKPDGEVFVLKKDLPAWKFCNSIEYETFLEKHLPTAQTVLLHARAATIGNPRDEENNHPMW